MEKEIKEIAEQYQGLFDLMKNEHNLLLTISEMNEIIYESQKIVNVYNRSQVNDIKSVCEHQFMNNTSQWKFCIKCNRRFSNGWIIQA